MESLDDFKNAAKQNKNARLVYAHNPPSSRTAEFLEKERYQEFVNTATENNQTSEFIVLVQGTNQESFVKLDAGPDILKNSPSHTFYFYNEVLQTKGDLYAAESKGLFKHLEVEPGEEPAANNQVRIHGNEQPKIMIKEIYDREYVETVLLPAIQKISAHEAYLSYDAFIANEGTGYKPGMDINQYLKSVWNNNVPIEKEYKLPDHLK